MELFTVAQKMMPLFLYAQIEWVESICRVCVSEYCIEKSKQQIVGATAVPMRRNRKRKDTNNITIW